MIEGNTLKVREHSYRTSRTGPNVETVTKNGNKLQTCSEDSRTKQAENLWGNGTKKFQW